MKKLKSLLLFVLLFTLVMISLALPSAPSLMAAPLDGNRIDVGFQDEFIYEVEGDTFTNAEVIGKRWWRTNFANWTDETGAPAIGVKVMH